MQATVEGPGAAGRFWNRTLVRTYLFNAFSLLLPAGEQFVVQAMEDAAMHLPRDTALRQAVDGFVREERAHQRAHRQYNAQLQAEGYQAHTLEARIERAVEQLARTMSWQERLALAAALEYLTALVSRQALRGDGWLVDDGSRQARLWRWHCAEEVAHHAVALRLLREVGGSIGYLRRVGLYVLASLILLGDVARHMADFCRTDRARGGVGWVGAALSLAGFVAGQGLGLARMAAGWWGYALPLRWLARTPAGEGDSEGIEVRLLQPADIPQLLVLERRKWSGEQAASPEAMAERMAAQPQLCMGAFCTRTGEVLASLFLKPISQAQLRAARTWADCAAAAGNTPDGGRPGRDLFGISLSSIQPEAVDAIFAFFWPRALHAGWRHIYLGSPVLGLARWLARQHGGQGCVESYVRAVRAGLPQDPQLRYYWRKGFRTIVACKPDYFPHPESMDYGVVVRGRIPLSTLGPVWRRLPLAWLQGLGRHVFAVL